MSYSTLVTRTIVGSSLPLAYQASPKLYKSVTVAQLTVGGLVTGDLVHAYGAGQAAIRATNEPDRAMHARYLKATKTGSNVWTEGLLLHRPMGVNFLDDQHYSLLDAAGSFVVTDAWAGSVQLMLVMYAANLSGNPADSRTLEMKYVELRADIHKGVEVTVTVNDHTT